eukprot:gene7533-7044_t
MFRALRPTVVAFAKAGKKGPTVAEAARKAAKERKAKIAEVEGKPKRAAT